MRDFNDLTGTDFIPYIEPKKKKKYYLYNINGNEGWCRTIRFINDEGYDTHGNKDALWDQTEKVKLENEYIEV